MIDAVSKMNIQVSDIGPSSCTDSLGAVDASITILDSKGRPRVQGEVTLVRDHNGNLCSWGSLHNWATESLHKLPRPMLEEIVASVISEAQPDA